jgi:DNA-binding transcriptional regulator YiaG
VTVEISPKRFRTMRKEMEFSQALIAHWFGVTPQSVGRWERGEITIPGSARILLWLLYEEEINGNKQAMHDYLKRFAPRQVYRPLTGGQ